MRRLLTVLRYVLLTIAWVACAVVAVGTSFALHLDLPIARRVVRRLISDLATHEIRGELQIGSLKEMRWDHLVATDVELRDAGGRKIVVAKRLTLTPDLDTLLRQLRTGDLRSVHIKSARIDGGTVHLIDDGKGSPTLFTAFDARRPKLPAPGDAPTLLVTLDKVELHDMTAYGELLGLSGLRATRLEAYGTMSIDDHVDVSIERARCSVVEPFGFTGTLDAIRGTISTRPERGVVLHAKAQREQERASVRLDFKPAGGATPANLDLHIDGRQVSYDTLRRFGYGWAKSLSGHADATLRLHGPPDDLSLELQAATAGGPLRATGNISTARGVTLHFASDNLKPDLLVPNAPSLALRGTLDLSTAPAAPEPRLHVHLAALRYKGVSIPAIEADAVVEAERVRIERAKTTASGARLSVRGSVGLDASLDLEVDAHFPAIERDPNLSQLVQNVSGELTARLHLKTPSVTARLLNIRGTVTLQRLVYGAITAERVTLTGSALGDPDLPRLNVEVKSEATRVMAYSLGNARFALRGGPRGYEAEGEFQSQGQKTFYFSAKVAADRKGFVMQADPIELTVGENTWRGLARDVTVIHGDRVELGLLRLASRSQRLEAQAVIRQDGEDSVTAQLQNFDLSAVRALLGASFPFTAGNADATFEAHGDVAKPELSLQGAMRGGAAFDIEGIDALYSITYAAGKVEVDSEVDVSGRGTLGARGTGLLDADIADPVDMVLGGRWDLEFSGAQFDLTLLPRVKDELTEGLATGTLLVKGTLDAPDLTSKVVLSRLRIKEFEPLELTTDLTFAADKLAGALSVADAHGQLAKAAGHLNVQWSALRADTGALGQALLSGHWQLIGETAARRLDRLPVHLPSEWSLPIVLGTHFDLLKAAGPTQGSVRFSAKPLQNLEYEQCGLSLSPVIDGTVLVDGGTTKFSFTGNVDGKRIAFGQGDVDLRLDEWLAGQGTAPRWLNIDGNLDVASIERFPWLCTQGRGELHMSWIARDLLTDHPNATVKVSSTYLPRLAVKVGRRNLAIDSCGKDAMRIVLGARIDKQQLVVTGQTSGCHGGVAEVHVDVPLAWQASDPAPTLDEQRDIRVDVDFQDAQLRPLLDRIPGVLSFSALAKGHLTARGSARGVDYRGQVSLHDGKLYPIATGQELKGISATLTGQGTWAKIENAIARAGDDGKLQLSGGLGFKRWKPHRIELAMLLDSFPIQREGVDLAWLTGSGALATDIGEERAITAIKLHALSVELPAANNRSLQALEDHPDITLTTDTPEEHPDIPYVLEFFLDGRRKISVARNDFDAVVTTELAMSYQEPMFRVGGYVEFQRGTFSVFGKDFRLTRGSMHFDGTGELNPEVNMVATHDPGAAGSSPIVVTVTGTLAEPQVQFQSDSCPGDGAIVMLVSGRCPDQDTWTAGDPASDRNAFTAGIVGGILTLGAQRELGGLIPKISVESTGQGSQARVKAGFDAVPKFMRSLVQRVYVQGAVSTSEEAGLDPTTQSSDATLDFLIELYFPHNIVGSGRFAPDHYWGLDVTWEP